MLAELETGSIPDPDVAVAESLPTPVARLPHEYDLARSRRPRSSSARAAPRRKRTGRAATSTRGPRKGAR
jgi:hypothetical protein